MMSASIVPEGQERSRQVPAPRDAEVEQQGASPRRATLDQALEEVTETRPDGGTGGRRPRTIVGLRRRPRPAHDRALQPLPPPLDGGSPLEAENYAKPPRDDSLLIYSRDAPRRLSDVSPTEGDAGTVQTSGDPGADPSSLRPAPEAAAPPAATPGDSVEGLDRSGSVPGQGWWESSRRAARWARATLAGQPTATSAPAPPPQMLTLPALPPTQALPPRQMSSSPPGPAIPAIPAIPSVSAQAQGSVVGPPAAQPRDTSAFRRPSDVPGGAVSSAPATQSLAPEPPAPEPPAPELPAPELPAPAESLAPESPATDPTPAEYVEDGSDPGVATYPLGLDDAQPSPPLALPPALAAVFAAGPTGPTGPTAPAGPVTEPVREPYADSYADHGHHHYHDADAGHQDEVTGHPDDHESGWWLPPEPSAPRASVEQEANEIGRGYAGKDVTDIVAEIMASVAAAAEAERLEAVAETDAEDAINDVPELDGGEVDPSPAADGFRVGLADDQGLSAPADQEQSDHGQSGREPPGDEQSGEGAMRLALRDASSRLAAATNRISVAEITAHEAALLVRADSAALVVRSVEGPRVLWIYPGGRDTEIWGPQTLSALLASGAAVRQIVDGDPLADGASTALLVVPVPSAGSLAGVILARRNEPDPFTAIEENYLDRLGRMCGAAVDALTRRGAPSDEGEIDPLTRLGHSDRLVGDVKAALRTSAEHNMQVSLVLAQVEGLAEVEAELGRAAADGALVAVASTVAAQLRIGDLAYRSGDHEIAVLLPATELRDAEVVAGRLMYTAESAAAEQLDRLERGETPDYRVQLRLRATAAPVVGTAEGILRSAREALTVVRRHSEGSRQRGRRQAT